MMRQGLLAKFGNDCAGNIAVMTALAMPVLVGMAGLGTEVGYWYYLTRGMQNAADSAAVAAATNGGSSYAAEAQAVAGQYGFQNGVNNVVVNSSNAANCPSGGNSCYSVTISSVAPLLLSQLVGYTGTTKISGTGYTALSATAIAKGGSASGGGNACVVALDPTDFSTATATGGNLTLNNCNLAVNSSNNTAFKMTGGTIKAGAIDVVGNYSSTGGVMNPLPVTGQTPVVDPYTGLYSANSVANMPSQAAAHTNFSVTGGSATLSPGVYRNGLSITGGTVTFSPGVYIIQGGSLSFTGGVETGSGVTFVLTNYNGSYATASLTGGSATLTAPTSGAWSGMLLYADPSSAAKSKSSSVTGGSLTMTGALYFPTQNLTYTGGAGASSCTQVLGYTLTLTGSSNVGSSCAGTGVQTIASGGRGQLVY